MTGKTAALTSDWLRLSVGRLVDGLGGESLQEGAILICRGEIVQVGAEQSVARPEGARCLVFSGRATAIPGLIDSHVHLTFDPDAPPDAAASNPDGAAAAAAAVDRAHAAAKAGVLTLFDCGSTVTAGLAVRNALLVSAEPGPRLLISGPPITPPGGHCHYLGGETSLSEHAVRARVGELAQRGVDGFKVMATGGLLTSTTDPSESSFPRGVLAALVDEAHRLGKRVTAHAHGVDGMRACAESGVDSIEHASMVGPGGRWQFETALAHEMADKAIRCVSTLTAGTGEIRKQLEAVGSRRPLLEALAFETRLKNFGLLREAGIGVIAGTDAGTPATDFGTQLHAELDALVQSGMSPREAISSATLQAARHLGIDHCTGSLTPGKAADIVILGDDPSRNIRHLTDIRAVFRGGQEVRSDKSAGG